MPSLKLIVPEGPPQIFSVYKTITSIGSGPENDICVAGSQLADHHGQVVFDGRDFNLHVVAPGDKARINDKKRRKSRLVHNDRVELSDCSFVFSIFDEVTPPGVDARGADPAAELRGLRQLYEFSHMLLQRHDLGALLEALMDAVVELTSAGKGFLILMENGQPQIRVARNLKRESIGDAVEQLSDTILRRVVEQRRPLIVSDAVNDSTFSSSESVLHLQLTSVICVPLLEQGDVLGIIYVGSDNVINLFTERTLDLLTVFAAQASLIIQNALLLDSLKLESQQLKKELTERRYGDIIGSCPSMLEVFRRVSKVAATDISVLIGGETGTGKELIAREIHARSPRAKGPFVTINCGAIPESLMESELFGHVRGAFTGAVATRPGKFQAANQGTIFLDEIGELPLNLQVKLLRVLQERVVAKIGDTRAESVDIRVLAASNRDLEQEVKAGTFREDLFYRLNVVGITLPPLRDRGEDIVLVARYLLQKQATEYDSRIKGFTPNALIAMRKYDWPGNIRQLENRIKKAVVLCDKSMIGPEDMDLLPETMKPVMSLAEAKEEFQHRYVQEILERNNGNRTKTARDLGVDPRTIFRYLEKDNHDA
jgi:transcriptional regulator with GAF, ATPase, and Fis domain